MIQILPQPYHAGTALGEALGGGFQTGFSNALDQQKQMKLNQQRFMQEQALQNQLFQQKSQTEQEALRNKQQLDLQQQSRLSQSLSNIKKIQDDPNLTPQEKQIGVYEQLASNPTVAKSLGSQLAQLNKESLAEEEKEGQRERERQRLRTIEKQRNLPEGSLTGFEEKPELAEKLTAPPKPEKVSPQSEFEKTRQRELAKQYGQAEDQLSKSRDSLRTIDRIEKLSNKLSRTGLPGERFIKGAIRTADAEELASLGLAAIEPAIEIFNPRGAIPVQKIEMIKNRFAVSPFDTYYKAKGKINALRFINEQASERSKEKIALIQKYNGNPPSDILNKFDENSESMTDAMLDYDFNVSRPVEETTFQNLPNASDYAGKLIKNNKTGRQLKSDGKRWVPL